MPLPLLIPALLKGVCAICATVGTCYCAKKAYDAYDNNQKTKRSRHDVKSKGIDAANADNKKAREEVAELKKKLEAEEEKIKKLEKSLEEAKGKLNRSDLSEEERSSIKRAIATLQQELDQTNTNKKNILDQIKKLGERINKNNQTINNASSNPDDRHWIWEFLTLENILVLGGCYLLYKISKDDK